MYYHTNDIWPGIYSSHQRCLEAVNRLALNTLNGSNQLAPEAYVELLQYRLKTAKGEKKAEVLRRLTQLGVSGELVLGNASNSSDQDQTSPTPVQQPRLLLEIERWASWTTSRAVIFLTLLGALSIQIHHVAHLVNRISDADGLLLGYVFGSVSELTALLLTVHQARRGMLILFAFVQCWINVLYYCHLPELVIRLTLSALIAFVIYSYSELFTSIKEAETTSSIFN